MIIDGKKRLTLSVCLLLGFFYPIVPTLGGQDDAGRYSAENVGPSRWMNNGHQGDFEFGVWTHESAANGGAAGRFIGTSSAGAGDINTSGKSFGLYANPDTSPLPYAAATRKFSKPVLTTGDVLSFKLTVNNRSPGNRGFDLKDSSSENIFNFDVRSGGYYVNGDNGASLNSSHHSNTVFTFTFTQRERQIDYLIQREGGIEASTSGSFTADSGTLASVRFYISGAGTGAASNLYFNQFTLTTIPRGDQPLTLGERRLPCHTPSYNLRFSDPTASTVTMRHGGDNFTNSYLLTKGDGGVWSVDVRNILSTVDGASLQPGWHDFKFRINGEFESGPNRKFYLDKLGRLAHPPAVYLTWLSDPTTTMTVSWYNHQNVQNRVRSRLIGSSAWTETLATRQAFPHTERTIHTAEIRGLSPNTQYEFQVDGYEETFKFRTMPSSLLPSRSVTFGVGGDVDIGPVAAAMTSAISSKDPDFLLIGGDHAYEDARAENFWRWYQYMESWFHNARSPDGRMIPLVVGVGNHEVRNGFSFNHPDFDNSPEWRDRYASYYYRTFPSPNPQVSYTALDFGDYLSLIITDTEHTGPIITGSDPQTQWLAAVLDVRRNIPHVFPIHHVPAYTTYRSFNDSTSFRIRQHWVPLYENAGVQTVFEHHDHTFKRTKPLIGGVENPTGIRYLGDGLWGIGKRSPDTTRPYLETATDQHHVHLVTLTASGRTIEAVDPAGNFFGGKLEQQIDGKTESPTPQITNLTQSSLTLSWASISRAHKYKIHRSDGLEIETQSTTYTDQQWTPSAGYTYSITSINRSGTSNDALLRKAKPRQVWNLNNNLTWDETSVEANQADPDGDGLSNTEEYFHGTNPNHPESAQPIILRGLTNGNFEMLYKKNHLAQEMSVRVLKSQDLSLGNWEDAGGVHSDLEGELSGWTLFQNPVSPAQSQSFFKLEIEDLDSI